MTYPSTVYSLLTRIRQLKLWALDCLHK